MELQEQSKQKVLVIGLEEDLKPTIIGNLLKNQLSDCSFVRDLNNAYRELTSSTFDLIIVDTDRIKELPDFLLLIKNRKDQPFVILIATEPNQTLIECLLNYPAYNLKKPFNLTEFNQVIAIIKQSRRVILENQTNVNVPLRKANITLEIESSSEAIKHAYKILTSFFVYTIHKNEFNYIRLGLQEILRNALEHGSFGLNSEEKLKLCEDGQLEAFIKKQSQISSDKNLIITIKIELEEKNIVITTTDPGCGFDWAKIIEELDNSPMDMLKITKRGLTIIRQIFDLVLFNSKGNQITVIKKLS
ncbi:MAG: ATP-binding protein [Deltaproteobacteria bacterium]|nr:ATP-binding protein [Deltaproteobacteria bacterium]